MAFRGFTEDDLTKMNSFEMDRDSESEDDDEDETENEGRVGASASFSARGKSKMANNSWSVKSLPITQGVHVPKEALLSTSKSLSTNPPPGDGAIPNNSLILESTSPTSSDSDSANHSSDYTLSSSKLNESNCLDDSSNDIDFKQVQLVLHPNLPSPSSIGVKLDLATVKSLPLDWDNTASLNALIEFEQNRKKLEDLNDKRKKELKKALEEKTKKTEEDMKKISEISQELKKLDSTLSNDVSILRKQIEIASWDFNDAQKRFDKAEKEYLEAKLELFTKREKKELLTGHLCSIIEQNEFRKAKKLSDLMGQLEIGSKEIAEQKVNFSPKQDSETNSTDHNGVPMPS